MISLDPASEGIFADLRRGAEVSTTYQLTFTGDDLKALNKRGGIHEILSLIQAHIHAPLPTSEPWHHTHMPGPQPDGPHCRTCGYLLHTPIGREACQGPDPNQGAWD